MEEEDGVSDEWAILSKELETWAVVWEMVREAKNDVIVYYPPPNVCVDVNALHFHITGVSLWAIMKSIN